MTLADDRSNWVGPVLSAGAVTTAVVQALIQTNPGLSVVDRGAYVRVLSRERCLLDGKRVEALLGSPFTLPADLERIMPAFRGMLRIDSDRAVWEAYGGPE